ncbi:MAG: DUF2271 domain-containing protein [Bacteroidales bacterium]|nr:DUF2271 domain-containing protein [Bacteroidales bacterium]
MIRFLICSMAICLGCSFANAQNSNKLEVSFDYTKQQGPGSNQYGVWIENAKGDVVKTLFITSFTSKGANRGGHQTDRGYRFRPTCVQTWVSHAKADELTDSQIDGFTGATPKESGKQTFVWDFTDNDGNKVADGKYKVFIEATYFQKGVTTYCGDFSTTDKASEIKLSVSENDESVTEHKDMVQNVKAVLK